MRTIHGAVLVGTALALAGCGSSSASGGNGDNADAGADDGGTSSEAGSSDDGGSGPGEGGSPGHDSGASEAATDGGAAGLHVEGNKLVDDGKPVRLLGVDRSGTEYACIQGNGFFDGQVDQAAVTAILGWHTNAVRVPLNEDCWLGINGAPAQ